MALDAFSLYSQYRSGSQGPEGTGDSAASGPYMPISSKHHNYLGWLDRNITLSGEAEGQTIQDDYSYLFPQHDPIGMEQAEEAFKTTVGIGYDPTAYSGSAGTQDQAVEGEYGMGHPFDWEKVSVMPSGQTPAIDVNLYDPYMSTAQAGSELAEYGTTMEEAWNTYKDSAEAKREELMQGASSAISQMGLMSGTSGQIIRSGEAMRDISSEIEDASSIARNLSETYKLGTDTADITFESGLETAFNTYMTKVDQERVNWKDDQFAGMTYMSAQDLIEGNELTGEDFTGFDFETEEACEYGFDPVTGECIRGGSFPDYEEPEYTEEFKPIDDTADPSEDFEIKDPEDFDFDYDPPDDDTEDDGGSVLDDYLDDDIINDFMDKYTDDDIADPEEEQECPPGTILVNGVCTSDYWTGPGEKETKIRKGLPKIPGEDLAYKEQSITLPKLTWEGFMR